MDSVTDQDLPVQGVVENPDGSADIEIGEEVVESEASDFQENLAELLLEERELRAIAGDLIDSIELDKKAREKRDAQYEEGLRRTGLGDDAPGGADFEGAADVVHPVLAEACVDFAARAIKELFPPQGPVKTAIIGPSNEAQLDRAERKRTFLNWQLTTQMPEYRSELEQLLTQLPLGGSQFQKFWYDERFKRPTSEFVPIDDILLPYAASSFYTSQRVTHVQHITQFEFERRIKVGLYRDIKEAALSVSDIPDQTASAEANDKIEGKEPDAYNEDGLRDIYEVYCWQILGDDMVVEGEHAPYIITIDAHSEKVLAIYRNWKEEDTSYEKLDWIVEWKFIPWRGAYAIGFPQLIGSLSAAATGALRALLDAAHFNNSQTLVKLKQGKMTGQNVVVEQAGVTDIEGPAGIDDIRKVLMAMPYNPPSAVLFQLLSWLTDAAKQVVATTEDAIKNAGDRTPVGTTQAMIEQGSAIYSAIHSRLHESQKKALSILCRINSVWLDEQTEVEDLGKLLIRREEFEHSTDVIPVSDPAIFSEAQRYSQNQSLMAMQHNDAADPSIPWNKVAIRRRMLKQMRIDNIDELLPLPPKPITADPLTENMAMLHGQICVPNMQQSHVAHIQAHMAYVNSPMMLEGQGVPAQQLMMILQHTQQHFLMAHQKGVMSLAQEMIQMGQVPDPDSAIAAAMVESSEQFGQAFGAALQKYNELMQKVQAKMPQPQMPPEVMASLQIAQMDTQRKAQYDQGMLKLKEQEQANQANLDRAQLQLDQMAQRMDGFFENQRVQNEARRDDMANQLQLVNNIMDNIQKQMTELSKNRDDNNTNLQIAMLEQKVAAMQSATQPSNEWQPQVADFSEMAKQVQQMIDGLEKERNAGAMTTVMEGLKQVMTQLNSPLEYIRDKDGKVQGARRVRDGMDI